MRGLRFVLQLLLALLGAVTYGWIVALIGIVRRVVETIKARYIKEKIPHPFKNASGSCLTVSHPAFRRPDPCIYSQSYLMKLGLPVTWDNPDIILRRNGVVVPEHDLLPGTLYEIEATIWNNSYDAPVLGMKVEFSFLSFGIGATQTIIGNTVVNVGVKGGPNHPAKTTIPWTTPTTPGHYCIQARLDWVDDANQENNLGQNNVDVAIAQSPAHFSFVLRNRFTREHLFHFTVDTYTPLEPPDCNIAPFPRERRSQRIRRIVALHQARDFSVPAGWTVTIAPDSVSLVPGAEATVNVDVTPPAGFSGEKAFNVNAFGDGIFAGGVTLVARTP
jgi:hypothetical protein